jgi:hypothetical protein
MQKWEYCVISGADCHMFFSTHFPYLNRFDSNSPRGYSSTRLESTKDKTEQQVVAETNAQLGEDGWELVSADVDRLYFKRPKELSIALFHKNESTSINLCE